LEGLASAKGTGVSRDRGGSQVPVGSPAPPTVPARVVGSAGLRRRRVDPVQPLDSTWLRRRRSCSKEMIAALTTAMWSVAVLEPALPGRSSPGQRFLGTARAVIGVSR